MLIVDFNIENICIGQTDRQTPLLYIQAPMPGFAGEQHMPSASPSHFIAPQLTHTFVIEPIQHGSGGETGRLYR